MTSRSRLPAGLLLLVAAGCLGQSQRARADDLPPAQAPPREVAADGTVSVIVDPPQAPKQSMTPPASGQSAAAIPEDPATALLAKAVEPLSNPAAEPLYARPLPLLEALERSGDRTRRLWITQAYWKVAAAFATVRFATESVDCLELIAPGGAAHDRAVLDAATAAGRAAVSDARAELIAAQQELIDLVRLPMNEPLPWTVDRPLAVPYQTQFETIFATRAATGRVRAINRTLPVRHEAIGHRAAAVAAAEEAFGMAEADHAKGQRAIDSVVAAQATLLAEQCEFAKAIRSYNCDIAEYVMAVADLSVPDERFASMLIGAPVAWRPQATAAAQPAGLQTPVIAGGAAEAAAVPQQFPPAGSIPVAPPVFVPAPGIQPAAPVVPAIPVPAP